MQQCKKQTTISGQKECCGIRVKHEYKWIFIIQDDVISLKKDTAVADDMMGELEALMSNAKNIKK